VAPTQSTFQSSVVGIDWDRLSKTLSEGSQMSEPTKMLIAKQAEDIAKLEVALKEQKHEYEQQCKEVRTELKVAQAELKLQNDHTHCMKMLDQAVTLCKSYA
jgi:ribosomal protein S16